MAIVLISLCVIDCPKQLPGSLFGLTFASLRFVIGISLRSIQLSMRFIYKDLFIKSI